MKSFHLRRLCLTVGALLFAFTLHAQTTGEYLYVMRGGNVIHKEKVAAVDSIGLDESKTTVSLYNAAREVLYSAATADIDSISLIDREPNYILFMLSSATQLTAKYDAESGEYTIHTTKTAPSIYTNRLMRVLPADSCVLTFEYQADQDISDLQVYFGDPVTEERSIHMGKLEACNEWRTVTVDVKKLRETYSWGKSTSRMRFLFGNQADVDIKIRHIYFRSLTAQEKAEAERRTLLERTMLWFNVNSGNQLTITHDAPTDVYTITTTGGDPYVLTTRLTNILPADSCVFSFEYLSNASINDLQVFFADPVSEARSVHMNKIASSQGKWAEFRYTLKDKLQEFNWGRTGDYLRMDFGTSSGKTIQVRNVRFAAMNAAEIWDQHVRDSILIMKNRMQRELASYLDTTYASKITSVEVTDQKVIIKGQTNGEGEFALVEVTPYQDLTEIDKHPYRKALTDKEFTVTLARTLKRKNVQYDRLLSKWAIVKVDGDVDILDSHAHYADTVTPLRQAEYMPLLGKKGIAAGWGSAYIADFDLLQAHSITMNVVLNSIINTSNTGKFTEAYEFGGKTYYISPTAINQLDGNTKAAYERGVIVSAILLTQTGSIFQDPECVGGYYSMPNMTTAAKVNLYAAVLNYLAERYSTPQYGRIHHWIMHNEVDMGQEWTNMGEQPMLRYLDRYMKSMRMCYNIVRQYDQHASVLGSYTHNWTTKDGEYAPKEMLDYSVRYSQKEGDFLWGVAYHPYPIDLTQPEFWKNDVSRATFTKNSPYCTFYNPEVINDWILDKTNYYRGVTKRILFFSEQGTNARSYSANDLTLQAAGGAWFWKKINQLDGIDAVQWHAWIDNRAEFGLRIGLRSFDDGDFKAYDAKPVWYVWQAADTEKEDEVFAPYLDIIGISDWNIVRSVK